MFSKLLWLLAILTPSTLAAPFVLEETGLDEIGLEVRDLNERADTYPCTNGIFVLTVRATDYYSGCEPGVVDPRYNETGDNIIKMGNAIIAKAGNNSYMRAVPYSACAKKYYFNSTAEGVNATQKMIKAYVNKCKTVGNKNPRIMLLGYSQGAQVIDTTLMGGNLNGTVIPNIDAYKQYITGGAVFGSPAYRAKVEPVDYGNGTKGGVIAHTAAEYTYLNKNYGAKFRTYCLSGDRFCDSGGNNKTAQQIHLGEVSTFKANATTFLLSLVK